MGAMFRSQEMALAQLFIQPEAAYFALSEMGEVGCAQFRDLNKDINAFQRKFVSEVRRCDELERKLRFIESEVRKDNVRIPDVNELPKAPNPREIIDLEAHLEKTEGDIKELTENSVNLKSNYLELIELRHVLEKTQSFFLDQDEVNGHDPVHKALIPDELNVSIRGHLGFVAGVINRERVPGFERMLWRVSRGNVFLRRAEIEKPLEDPQSGNEYYKTVFVAFFQGEQLKTRIKKVCAGFHASLYPCPNTQKERVEMLQGVKTRLEDLQMVLNQTEDHRQRVLVSVAKELQNWSIMVCKMKAIYHTLNLFNMDVTKKCLIGECWLASSEIPVVQKALADGSSASGSSIPSFLNIINTNEMPPTYNRTNKFTRGFQNLIDVYGIASYRECNPALYTIITFPFLFAVMFGDCGHAIIMAAFGLWLIVSEKKIAAQKGKSEIFNIFFGGRYIILLMGIFSFYTGLVYNDIFSKSVNIFGSAWRVNQSTLPSDFAFHGEAHTDTTYEVQLTPKDNYRAGSPYFLGLDPAWQVSKNKIIFLNSFKMKLSIIIAVVHMIFGVTVSTFNFVHFKKYSSLLLEFVPQVLLLCFLFLWMVIMIFIKWTLYAGTNDGIDSKHGSACAPSVLIYFINMMLFKESEAPFTGCDVYMFEGQPIVEKILIFGALICMPVMLLGKPFLIMCTRKNSKKLEVNAKSNGRNGDVNQGLEMNEVTGNGPEASQVVQHADAYHEEEEHEEPMSEIWVHQGIHTIEYVLSTISHTASYLRLWALSLAHAQLSEVLWGMVFQMGLKTEGWIGCVFIFIFFAVWAVFTLAILVLMEGLSAFLHTLRLHWVEFMSKFYAGQGYAFEPFSFKKILDENEEEAG
ncbi:V-type proton ATPase 116 kDa subunit a 1 [Anthonomus grandis grandis]|uniref:V-type proton ATPase 116 kDa subunit a 1 n=1 Tax=Anthonomus grandis grandis TaxID=2921223 RepID=UPI0021661328|nr:V-type proton ATPase 116 kDa subunit a 1 [Anthonomus grandis grandis]XP_050293138.1 V-type proton ATPase 116 kDa subunit a 1 [Anthonomus grandis grandis]XP_050293139.1 V-type proton ATPase 116 kDa subunit a 1 [Anthonomus grandis grandis]XP_050293140.1 V-type proton ATPase 116 kDa subunit a 1 [Anthonomus grandis grandis]